MKEWTVWKSIFFSWVSIVFSQAKLIKNESCLPENGFHFGTSQISRRRRRRFFWFNFSFLSKASEFRLEASNFQEKPVAVLYYIEWNVEWSLIEWKNHFETDQMDKYSPFLFLGKLNETRGIAPHVHRNNFYFRSNNLYFHQSSILECMQHVTTLLSKFGFNDTF